MLWTQNHWLSGLYLAHLYSSWREKHQSENHYAFFDHSQWFWRPYTHTNKQTGMFYGCFIRFKVCLNLFPCFCMCSQFNQFKLLLRLSHHPILMFKCSAQLNTLGTLNETLLDAVAKLNCNHSFHVYYGFALNEYGFRWETHARKHTTKISFLCYQKFKYSEFFLFARCNRNLSSNCIKLA